MVEVGHWRISARSQENQLGTWAAGCAARCTGLEWGLSYSQPGCALCERQPLHTSVPLYLLNHKAAVLRWSCLAPGWSALPEAEVSSPTLHMVNVVLVLKGWLCLLCGCRWNPLPSSWGRSCWTQEWRDSVSVISSLTLAHLYSSVRPETWSSRMPLLYSPMLLKHLGTPSWLTSPIS